MIDYVMDLEHRKQYTFARKLHGQSEIRDQQIAGLREVVIHNGFSSDEMRSLVQTVCFSGREYFPPRSSELHMYMVDTGVLHVVNARGVTRLERDKNQVEVLREVLQRDIVLNIRHFRDDPSRASRRFKDFAFDLVNTIFSHDLQEKVQASGKAHVVFGPLPSFPQGADSLLAAGNNDYLSYQVFANAGVIINFDYVFGDQASHVLREVFQVLSDHCNNVDVNVVHFGKVGVLNPSVNIGDVCLPSGALEETEVLRGDSRIVPMHNQLVLNERLQQVFVEELGIPVVIGKTVNTVSVLKQTRSGLEKCLAAGGDFLDMEWSVMDGLGRGYQVNYPNLGKLSYFFVGIASDKPLMNETLANTEYPADREVVVGKALKELLVEL